MEVAAETQLERFPYWVRRGRGPHGRREPICTSLPYAGVVARYPARSSRDPQHRLCMWGMLPKHRNVKHGRAKTGAR